MKCVKPHINIYPESTTCFLSPNLSLLLFHFSVNGYCDDWFQLFIDCIFFHLFAATEAPSVKMASVGVTWALITIVITRFSVTITLNSKMFVVVFFLFECWSTLKCVHFGRYLFSRSPWDLFDFQRQMESLWSHSNNKHFHFGYIQTHS